MKIEKRLVPGVHTWRSNNHTSSYAQEAQKLFNIHNKLEIVEHYGSYVESFGYGGGLVDSDLDDFYLNNICLLKTFNKIFLSKAKGIINHIEKNNEYLTVNLKNFPPNKTQRIQLSMPSFNSDADLHFSYIDGERQCRISLSPQQFNVLSLKMRGYSDEFISRCLSCTIHNVKYHYKNALRKIKPNHDQSVYSICEKMGFLQVSQDYQALLPKQ